MNEMKLLICSGATEFSDNLGVVDENSEVHNTVFRFEDNEMCVRIDDLKSLINEDVLVVQSLSNTVNDNIIELLFTLDVLKNIDTKSVKLLITYAGYSRQDRVEGINESFSFKVLAKMLSNQNLNKIYFVDIHASQTAGFFDVPAINIDTQDFVCDLIKNKYENPLLISPDVGNVKKIVSLSNKMSLDYSIAIKYRPRPNENKILSLVGASVENKDCIIIDDIIDSAGTLCNVAERLAKNGANNIIAYKTHPVLSKKSFERINNSYFTKLYVSDTINTKEKIELISGKVSVFSVADYVLSKIIEG